MHSVLIIGGRIFKEHPLITDFFIIMMVWSITLGIVNPFGNFPLNDDWHYGLAVERMLEDGEFHPTRSTAMTLVSQVLWGALFCLFFGFSFNTLRFSTLTLSLIGSIGIYLLLRQLNCNRFLSVSGALILLLNPIYFSLSNSFMTDVPFLTCIIFVLLFFIRFLEDESDIDLIFGTVLLIIAILCRQLGLFLPAAFGVVILVSKGFSLKWTMRALIPIIVSSIVLLVHNEWLELSGNIPAYYGIKERELFTILKQPSVVIINIIYNIVIALLYLGFFLFPFLIFLNIFITEKGKWRLRFSITVFFLFVVFVSSWLFSHNRLMPLSGNILFKGGIGPILLRDEFILHLNHYQEIRNGFWLFITIISIVGGGILLSYLTSKIIDLTQNLKHFRENLNNVFFLLCILIYFLPISIHGFYDRYLLPFIPILLAIIVPSMKSSNMRKKKLLIGVSILSFSLIAFLGIAGTRDYLTWNRIRWKALNKLVLEEKIPPSQIDGGLEFNGLYLCRPAYYNYYDKSGSKSWWWVIDDLYMVTMGKVLGYDVKSEYKFFRWIPPGEGVIYIIKRPTL
jgi:hypothetical protein